MRQCPKCGAENQDTADVCNQCASRLQQSGGKTCPSGRHTMDPTWTECVYCQQENASPVGAVRTPTVLEGEIRGREKTVIEGDPNRPLPPRPPRPVSPVSPPSNTNPLSKPERSPTRFPEPRREVPPPPVAKGRKIVGILISYSWVPEGQIFPIRVGRNLIGRDADCEVSIPEDQTLSGRNSHITFRQNFVIGDMISMAGTDLEGVPIEEQFHSLGNYATIRAGSTYFTFIAIEPPSAVSRDAKP